MSVAADDLRARREKIAIAAFATAVVDVALFRGEIPPWGDDDTAAAEERRRKAVGQ